MDGLGYSCHLEPVPWVLVLLSVLVFINMHLCFQLLSTASGIQGWPAGASGEGGGGNLDTASSSLSPLVLGKVGV